MRDHRIDNLRGLSIFLIILIHLIAWHDSSITTNYTKIPFFFYLRDIFQFVIICLVFSSAYSLYKSENKLGLISWYKKRIKRLVFPWWGFLSIFFLIHFLLDNQAYLSIKYITQSYLMIGGIGFGWLIFLLLILTILFPLLNYLHKKKLTWFIGMLYLISYFGFYIYPINIFQGGSNLGYLFFSLAFILGWSFAYMIGFFIFEKNKYIYIFSIILVISILIVETPLLYLNKYPPSPYFIAFGIIFSFPIMHLKKSRHLEYFSKNSLWIFMWSGLVLSLIKIPFNNIYVEFFINLTAHLVIIIGIIFTQKKLIKISTKLFDYFKNIIYN